MPPLSMCHLFRCYHFPISYPWMDALFVLDVGWGGAMLLFNLEIYNVPEVVGSSSNQANMYMWTSNFTSLVPLDPSVNWELLGDVTILSNDKLNTTFTWLALYLFTSILACNWSIWLFWFTSLWREPSQRGSPPLKVNVKIFKLDTTFKILVQIMQNFQILTITLLCFEFES